jgi:S-DNA-T family DNA segregation ATPase FtsK/SpoIIIE
VARGRSARRADTSGSRGSPEATSDRKHRRSKKKLADAGKIREDAGGIGGVEEFDPDEETVTPIAEARPSGSVGVPNAEPADEHDEADSFDGDAEEIETDELVTASAATDEAEDEDEDLLPGAPQVFDPDDLRAKIEKLPLRFGAKSARSATDDDLRDVQNNLDMEGYEFPQLELLEAPELNYSEEMEVFVREQAEALERALKEYRINGEVVGIDSGPVITLYEVRLAPGTKVAQVSAVSSDLARALKAVNIRIVSNMAGRDTVGVEVPNAKKEKVRLRELMADSERYRDMALPMFLGKDASGEPLIQDLAQMPHLLIAGTTGSGKSVCMNAVIMSFLYTRKPNELKLVLVDPKMVELSQFKDIPHLMCPVVTEMSKAAAILEWAVGKMEERYALLAEAGCRDISAYNALSWDDLKDAFRPESPAEEARIPRKLPYMVFIIDELADMMMTNKEVEQSIVRLAQKARAVGIHLILATQRPQANVVTGLIKSNMPARISFKVASGMDSRIIMDQKGGELLLGQGDMLYLSPRTSKLMRAQGTLVDDKEIRRVVRFMREIASPSFERQLVSIRSKTDEEMRDGLANAQEDPLFDAAVEIVLETKRGSVSMLQRRLAIGYTRAARLVEMMGEAGIIGQHKGTVAREVSMSVEEWRALKAQAAADAAEAAAADPADAHRSGSGAQADLFDSDDAEPQRAGADAAPPFEPTSEAAAAEEPDAPAEELVALADNAADAYDDEDDDYEDENEEDQENEEYEEDEDDDEDEDDEDLDDDFDEEDVENAPDAPAKPPVQVRTDRRGVQR